MLGVVLCEKSFFSAVFLAAVLVYGLFKLNFHPLLHDDSDILVRIVYHETTHELWLPPYTTLGEVLSGFDVGDDVDMRKLNESTVLAHHDVVHLPIVSDDPCVSINTAFREELQQLPGVGPAIAQRIIDYRSANGLFQNLADLKNVSGIGDKTYERISESACL